MLMKSENSGKGIAEEIKRDWLALVLIAVSLLVAFLIYPHLPERVPSHWNVKGQVDSYSSKSWGAFGLPLMTAGIYFLMVIVPRIDPKKGNYDRFKGAYRLIKLAFVLFFIALYAVVLMNAMGFPVPVDRMVIIAMGLLFMVIGNFMGQFRHNYFIGIKTPWTLASEDVWQKTHRFGARIWVGSGLVMAITGLFFGGQRGFLLVMASIAVAALVPVIYAYLLYKKTDAK